MTVSSEIYKARVGLILPTLTSLAARNERIFLVGLQRWMDFAHKQIRHDLTEKYIKKDITTELTDWEFIEEQGKEILKPTTLKIMQSGGNQAYKTLQAQVAFDVLNLNAVKAAGKLCGKLVREVTGETKKGIRGYIKAGIKEGKSMNKIARDLKPLVGLTANQTQSVVSYRNWLNEKRPELSAAQVDKRVMTYTNKTHRRRMQTIARTETARAQNIGYAVGLEDLGVDQVEFQTYPDEKTCDECEGLNHKKYKVGEGANVIPVHPNCRCCLLPVVADTSTCRMAKRMEKAGCISPDDLHDEQIKDLLKRLEVTKVPAEGRKIRRALRRLGHKGGLGGKPPVGAAPRVKPTVPTTIKPKPKFKPEILEHVGGTSKVFEDSVELIVRQYPTAVREGLFKSGVKIRTGKNITQINPNLSGVAPRGWPRGMTWDNAAGYYDTNTKVVAIAEKYRHVGTTGFRKVPALKSRGTLNHEVGHAFSRTTPKGALPYHNTDDFIKAYNKDIAILQTKSSSVQADFLYYMQRGPAGRSETFAESFARIMGKQAGGGNMAKHFPNSTSFIERLLLPKAPKPTISKLFEATNTGKAEANARRILGIPITDVKAEKK